MVGIDKSCLVGILFLLKTILINCVVVILYLIKARLMFFDMVSLYCLRTALMILGLVSLCLLTCVSQMKCRVDRNQHTVAQLGSVK